MKKKKEKLQLIFIQKKIILGGLISHHTKERLLTVILRPVHLTVRSCFNPEKANLQSLAVDWISEKVYWYDTFEQAIFVCTLYGDICKPIVYKNLQSTRSARFLQIDSARSRLYFDNAITIQSSYIPTHVIESGEILLPSSILPFPSRNPILKL